MDLSADVSGLIPSDLDAERGLVGGLIADPHCSDLTSSLPPHWGCKFRWWPGTHA